MLNVHSQYSFKYGIVPTLDIIDLVTDLGYPSIVLTDINNSGSTLGYVRECQERKFPSKTGIDFRNGITQLYVGVARNNRGMNELNVFLSEYLVNEKPLPERPPQLSNCHVIYPWRTAPRSLAPNEWIGVSTADLNRLRYKVDPEQLKRMVIMQPMTFTCKRDYNTHRLLRAIEKNSLLSQLPKAEHAPITEMFIPYTELLEAFAEFPGIITNTQKILDSSSIHFDFADNASPQNLATYTGNRAEDVRLLRRLVQEGITYRYGEPSQEVLDRVEKEITIIDQKDYISYFLITWDIVNFARTNNFFYVGRGSGANSLVAYLIRITDVDPLELDLYFERFINLFRKNPPDFDMDFSHRDRDIVTDYILKTFPNAALLATYSTFQEKAALREVGKVMGVPKSEIKKIIKGQFVYEQLDEYAQSTVRFSKYIHGLPSHLSIHAGGILISEKPTTWYSAVHMPPKGYKTVQFSMLEAEDVGLYKFDVLSQRGLSKIKECIDIVKYNQPDQEVHDIHDIPYFKEDPKIKEMLRSAKAIGCFYVESPAMRLLMIKLLVDDYLTLVAASSVIRPGVAKSGMMYEFIVRHRIPEKRKEAHSVLLEIMPETYGVMVYQEDVIKVAHYFAGLTLAEADVLRRGMSGKFRSRSEFQKARDRFFSSCAEKGYSEKITADVWYQIESFAGYSFSKGHSASYAVESYQSLYLKSYFPLEYMVACINNYGGFYTTEVYVREAAKLGGTIELPSVNFGSLETIICGTTIYLGFQLVRGIEEKVIIAILQERQINGVFKDFDDLVRRVYIPLEQLTLIITIGGLRDLKSCRKSLLWKAELHHNKGKQKKPQPSLFATPAKEFKLPELIEEPFEMYFDQWELLQFPLCNVFDLVNDPEVLKGTVLAADMAKYAGMEIRMAGYLIHIKDSGTYDGQPLQFGTFFDVEEKQFDTVHFAQALQQFKLEVEGGLYLITGTVVEDFGFYSLDVRHVQRIKMKEDTRFD